MLKRVRKERISTGYRYVVPPPSWQFGHGTGTGFNTEKMRGKKEGRNPAIPSGILV
jgi:hypothetical protein